MLRWVVPFCLVAMGLLGSGCADRPDMTDRGDGPLTPMQAQPVGILLGGPLRAETADFTMAGEAAGVAHPKAVVTRFKSDSMQLAVAIDAATPAAQIPDMLRLDFSGEGRFHTSEAIRMEISAEPGLMVGLFGPTKIDVQRDGRSLAVWVRGEYRKSGIERTLDITLETGLQGRCSFGDTIRSVSVLDGNNNLRMNDAVVGGDLRRDEYIQSVGDTVVVDLGDGTTARAFCGQPILVDGAWYDVTVSEDQTRITSRRVDMKTGWVRIAHDGLQVVLAGPQRVVCLRGGPQAIAVPAGEYALVSFEQAIGEMELVGRGSPKVVYRVSPGQTAEIAVGLPLQLQVMTTVNGPQVEMAFTMTGAGGAVITSIAKRGRQPDPWVDVYDMAGDLVHTGKFEYG